MLTIEEERLQSYNRKAILRDVRRFRLKKLAIKYLHRFFESNRIPARLTKKEIVLILGVCEAMDGFDEKIEEERKQIKNERYAL